MSSELQWAWAAGIIDGEGCIRLGQSSNSGRPSYTAMITVAMTHLPTIDRLQQIWGRGGRYSYKGNRKPMYQLQVNGKDAFVIAQKLLPFLFTKKRQAELLIEYGERCKHEGGWEKKISPEIQALRGAIYEELKELNA